MLLMKNITLSIDDKILEKVRIVAAHKRTTVNALVRDFLTEIAGRDERQAEARKELLRLMRRSRRAAWRRTGSSTARKHMSGKASISSSPEPFDSEDLSHGQTYGRVRCENPFRSN